MIFKPCEIGQNCSFKEILLSFDITYVYKADFLESYNLGSFLFILRAYSCPTQEALNELKEEKNGGDERESTSSRSTCSTGAEEVFGQQQPQPRDLLMAQSGYPLCYLGSLPVGKVGDTSFLDWAIRKVMNDPGKTKHSVSLHLLELGIKLYCRTTAELVLTYPYPKVI